MAKETRKSKRAPASLKVRFRAATVGEFIEQQTDNLSAGGIFIKSKAPLPRGTLMVFEFQLKDGAPLIKGVGRVVWTRRAESPSGESPGMGIKFIRIDPDSRETFESIMAGRGDAEAPSDVVASLEPGMGQPSVGERPDPLASGRPVRPSDDKPVRAAEEKPAEAGAGRGAVLGRVELGAKKPSEPPAEDEIRPEATADAEEEELAALSAWTPVPPPSGGGEPGAEVEADESGPPSLELDEEAVEEEAPARSEGSGPELLPPPDQPGSGATGSVGLELAEADDFAGLLDAAKAEGEEAPHAEAKEAEAPAEEEPPRPEPPEPAPAPPPAADEPLPPPKAEPEKRIAAAAAAAPAPTAPSKRSPITVVVVVVLAVVLLGASAYLVKLLLDRQEAEGDGGGATTARVVPDTPQPDASADHSIDGGAADGRPAAEDGGVAGEGAADALLAADGSTSEMVFGRDAGDDDGAPPVQSRGRTLLIVSDPPGTPVSINGTSVGRTPLTLTDDDLRLDRRLTIRLSRSGFDNWVATVRPDDPRWLQEGGGLRLQLEPTLERHDRRRGGEADEGGGGADEGGGGADEGGGGADEGGGGADAPSE